MNFYYPRKFKGPIGEWVNIDKFFDQAGLAAKLCAKYKYVSHLLVKKIKIKFELHVSYTVAEVGMTIETCDGIEDDNIKSLI